MLFAPVTSTSPIVTTSVPSARTFARVPDNLMGNVNLAKCVQGACEVCKDAGETLRVCPAEKDFFTSQVKYKWLRPIKIGNRNETVWAYDSKPYHEFTDLFCSYYEKYRLHNWIYKRQQQARLNCRRNL